MREKDGKNFNCGCNLNEPCMQLAINYSDIIQLHLA